MHCVVVAENVGSNPIRHPMYEKGDILRVKQPGQYYQKTATVIWALPNNIYRVKFRNGREEEIHSRWLEMR